MTERKFPAEEASASMRQMARMMREMFTALVQEGFTEAQAIAVIGQALQASTKSAGDQP
ncbi:MAG TPA: hypothetical protein VFV36_07810 [Candidatus Methylomirabilis sp.]|nr:hypothetical protein [Candidatus Methylomirabilis sp.]